MSGLMPSSPSGFTALHQAFSSGAVIPVLDVHAA